MPLPAIISAPILSAVAATAGVAGCAAFVDTRATRREAAWMAGHPPLGRLLSVEGRKIHVLETGQPRGTAPDLVLIHGANGNLRDFTFGLTARLGDSFRIVTLDRPGLGWSDSWGEADSDPVEQARILRLALGQLGLDRPVVVGHSYGGAVAMGWALLDQADTGALVLLAGATHPWDGPLGLWYRVNTTAVAAPARAMVSAFVPQATINATLASVFAPAPVPEGYAEHFGLGLSLRRETQANNTRQVNALLTHVTRMQPRYAALTLPIELVHGDADTTVGIDIHSRRLAAEVASANLTVLENGGHMPHHSHPEAVVAAIRRAAARAAAHG